MLVFTRKATEQIRVGPDVVITLVRVKGDKVHLGVDAPAAARIERRGGARRAERRAKGEGEAGEA